MSTIGWLTDGLLAAVLVALALRVLRVANLFHAVVLFISFGLLMALVWVRLAAPDVALAEAGIGAALTGVLLIEFVHRLTWQHTTAVHGGRFAHGARAAYGWPVHALCGLAAAALAALLLNAVMARPASSDVTSSAVMANIGQTGAEHPVTAVLLDFRSLDTLLELTVLLVAVLGVLSVRRTQPSVDPLTAPVVLDPAVDALPRLLLPLLVMVAGYMVWLGSFTAGGAFQGGIVVAAAIVLLTLTGRRSVGVLANWQWQAFLLVGVAAFVAVGAATLLTGRALLDYPPGWSTALVLLLELAATISIGVALATLFLGMSAPERRPISRGVLR